MGNLLNLCVTNLLREKKDGVEKQLMGWLEGYQIRLQPGDGDNVPLFLLQPHNELLLGPGCISTSSSALPLACPRFSSSPTWNERARCAGQLACGPVRRPWAVGKARLGPMQSSLESVEWGSNPIWPPATCAILDKPPGLSEVQYLSPAGFP